MRDPKNSSDMGMGEHVFVRSNNYGDSDLLMVVPYKVSGFIALEITGRSGDARVDAKYVLSDDDIERLIRVLNKRLDELKVNKSEEM